LASFRQAADLIGRTTKWLRPSSLTSEVLGMTIASLANLHDEWISSTTQGGVTMIDDNMPWDDLWTDLGGEG
jgi:hypothetical protein